MKSLILKKLGVETDDIEKAFDILTSSLKEIVERTGFSLNDSGRLPEILRPLLKLSKGEKEFLKGELTKARMDVEKCQVEVQRVVPKRLRKSLAAYYTVDEALDFMAEIVSIRDGRGSVLVDPFLGSGRTLTKVLERVKGVKKVIGMEPYYLAALVAYASLIRYLDPSKIEIINADVFELIDKGLKIQADFVLTNPPFTRWSNIPKSLRKRIIDIIENLGYSQYIVRRDPGLHLLSFFIIDRILKKGGTVVAVVPASTFQTEAGEGIKRMLMESYEILAILEGEKDTLSHDSAFKELVIVAKKSPGKERETFFGKLTGDLSELAKKVLFHREGVDLRNIPKVLNENWLVFLEERDLQNILTGILENEKLKPFEDIFETDSMIRGVEMYGTDFFFIPNRFWKVVEEGEESVVIEGEGYLEIDKRYLVKVLRKPSDHAGSVEVKPTSYALVIPPEAPDLDGEIGKYIRWGENMGVAEPAMRIWSGKGAWYSHMWYQVKKKGPFGNVFLPDKIDSSFSRRGVIANFSSVRTLATKNFYVVKVKGSEIQKILTLWYNSSVFTLIFLSMCKKISGKLVRFLEKDYLKAPVLDPGALDEHLKKELLTFFEYVKTKAFPPFCEQLNPGNKFHTIRKRLDILVLRAIGEDEDLLDDIYQKLRVKLSIPSSRS